MSKTSSDSFVFELPLRLKIEDQKELEKRLEAARHLYNACLGELFKRLKLCRESKLWQKGRTALKTKAPERHKFFQESKKQNHFSEYDMHSFAKQVMKDCFIEQKIDSSTAQKIATKAFSSVDQYLKGKRGKPRFKGRGQLKSIEGKSNTSGIRWQEDNVVWNVKKGKKLILKPLFDSKDPYDVQKHALSCRVKYVRIVKRSYKGNYRYFVQLILEGKAKQKIKHTFSDGIIGLDIGPSSLALYSERQALLVPFCSELKDNEQKIGTLQRKMDRSRRINNPSHYNADKTIKTSSTPWVISKRYRKLRSNAESLYHQMKETRKKLHGSLCNQILSLGNTIRTEALNYKAWQKNFGKSVGKKAPSLFLSLLRRKAESAGGAIEEISPWKTALSQQCLCGLKAKKPLSQRWHDCSCGIYTQRDLMSAYLACYVKENTLDMCQAKKAWPVAESLLEHAISKLTEVASGKNRLSSFGLSQRQSRSHVRERSLSIEALDAVEETREPKRTRQLAFRTP